MSYPQKPAFLTQPISNIGNAYVWGNNTPYAPLGDGTNTGNKKVPTLLDANLYSKVGAGDFTSYVVRINGTLFACGYNGAGGVGTGNTTTPQKSPVQVGSATNWKSANGGNPYSLFVATDHTLWAVGGNSNGECGQNNTTNPQLAVTQIGTDTDWDYSRSGTNTGGAMKLDGHVYCWGSNGNGECGQGNLTDPLKQPRLVNVGICLSFSMGANHGVVVKADGTLWAWGYNAQGQCGQGTTATPKSTPLKIGTDTDWISCGSAAYNTYAIKTNGTLWACGTNANAECGQGSTSAPLASIVQVGSDTNWKSVVTSDSSGFALAIKTNGTLYAWGSNGAGQCGQNNLTTPITSPAQIGALTKWKEVYAGSGHAIALLLI